MVVAIEGVGADTAKGAGVVAASSADVITGNVARTGTWTGCGIGAAAAVAVTTTSDVVFVGGASDGAGPIDNDTHRLTMIHTETEPGAMATTAVEAGANPGAVVIVVVPLALSAVDGIGANHVVMLQLLLLLLLSL